MQGQECREITEELIKALGDVIHTENTAEYFEEKVVNINKVRNEKLEALIIQELDGRVGPSTTTPTSTEE